MFDSLHTVNQQSEINHPENIDLEGSNFLLNRTNCICEHKFSPGHLPRLHQVCGKKFFFTTDGIVVENVLINKFHFIFVFYSIYFIMFYSISNYVMLL